MTSRWVIGVAPGSSLNGVDAALLELQGVGLDLQARIVQAVHCPYGRDLRGLLLRAAYPGDARQLAQLHRLLGETFASSARQVADQAHFSLSHVLCIGCPGHVAWQETEGRFPSALDLGLASVVAERTGVSTVSDFRSRDLAAGGQGMPIEAIADHLLFRHPQLSRCVIHLGGTASVIYLPADGRVADVIGFEAGPCNLFLDGLIRQLSGGKDSCDAGGKYAVQGRCMEDVLQRWLDHPSWQRRPPKGLSPQAFGAEFILQAVRESRERDRSLHDVLCTATHLIARGLGASLRRFLPAAPAQVFLSGGGTRNGFLWHLLEQQLAGTPLARTDAAGVPAAHRRAMEAGILATLTVDGVPASLPSATGAAGARLIGSLTPGSAANWGRCVHWMARFSDASAKPR
jgi:anhydro-N-acetylmuramic acid kinase